MDLGLLQWLIRARPDHACDLLQLLYRRYQAAPKPDGEQKHPVWYRMLVTCL
jgi:hypothetical protein